MRTLDVLIRQKIENQDDTWVQKARDLVGLLKKDDKEGQLRNIQSIAERSDSWKALELFIRYQAARKQIPKDWAEKAIEILADLKKTAESLLGSGAKQEKVRAVHMELVSRVLGYAVRWHVWDIKGKEAA